MEVDVTLHRDKDPHDAGVAVDGRTVQRIGPTLVRGVDAARRAVYQ